VHKRAATGRNFE